MAEIAVRFLLVTGLVLAGGCARELEGEDPPAKAFYYPVGITVTPGCATAVKCYAYVVNSNFDLRYNSGWISEVDVDALIGSTDMNAVRDHQLRVPSLGGELALRPSGEIGLLTVRGGEPMVRVDIAADGTLGCGAADAKAGLDAQLQRTDCDNEHFIRIDDDIVQSGLAESLRERADVTDEHVSDPFGAVIFDHPGPCANGCAAVSYLGSGLVSVIDFRQSGAAAQLRTVNLGNTLANAIVMHPLRAPATAENPTPGPLLAVMAAEAGAQRRFSHVYDIDVISSIATGKDDVVNISMFDQVGGVEATDLAFSPSGERAYVTNRSEDTIGILDSRLVPTDIPAADGSYVSGVLRPQYTSIDAERVAEMPSSVVYVSRATGGDLLAVVSFEDNALTLLSVDGDNLRLERRFDRFVGGPWDVVHVQRGAVDFLLVSAFESHGLAVINVTSADPSDWKFLTVLRNPEVDE
jgi:hypothetical protein